MMKGVAGWGEARGARHSPLTVSGRAMPRTKNTSAVCANNRRHPWTCAGGVSRGVRSGARMADGSLTRKTESGRPGILHAPL
jgi:hypothetical protein